MNNVSHTASLVWQRMPPSGRLFVRFWGGCVVAVGVMGVGLQLMGPPKMGGQDIDVASYDTTLASKTDIPAPQADLLENTAGPGGYALPKRGTHGHVARQVYAAPVVDVPAGSAQVALILTGVGDSHAVTEEALSALPSPISLALSPYTPDMKKLLELARANKHETLLALPVQPSQAPAKTDSTPEVQAGPKALSSSLSAKQNTTNYQWALSSLAGYVGVTNATTGTSTEDYTHSTAFTPILTDMAQRGLLYLNATPDTAIQNTEATGTADVNINTDADIVNIDIQLLKLQQAARRTGRAIGVMGPLRPVALACLRAWIPHLKDVGITLVPVSMLLAPLPAAPPTANTALTGNAAANGAMHVNLTNPNAGKRQ
ncbi:hypothetical protein HK15_12155 [Acetobacter orientalis]|uniref:Divergent polysaccharide deacetylase family protein n=1 Tax=Acetobacter orientalis TaxID=146474 RepID=A0A252BGH5_9PROT|nr:divergent polysaccharide deacetylase family protein [Acetobacter orientalis]OUJ03464.1 hypothetical protein HK15_12155 [Acetobacter orientalis]